MKPSVEVTETNFEAEVLKSNQPVLVEFATGWSLPSMTLDGVLEEIASESADFLKVARVKLDHSPNLGLWYGIRCIPTILYFVDGEERVGIFGTTSKNAILSQLKAAIDSNRAGQCGGRENLTSRVAYLERGSGVYLERGSGRPAGGKRNPFG